MQIQEIKTDEVLIVALEGRLDLSFASEFESRLVALIDGGERRICIDCSQLNYINSSGLKGFLIAAKKMASVRGKIVVSDLCPNTRKVFEIIGFTKVIPLVSERKVAIEYLTQQTVPA